MTKCVNGNDGRTVEQVKKTVLGCMFARDGKYGNDIERSVQKGNVVNGIERGEEYEHA